MADTETCSDVTVYCRLHGECESVVKIIDVRLSWVDKGGAELQNNWNHQIISPCEITLTEKLRDPKPVHTQKTWGCQVMAQGKVQTSADYTITVKGE